MDSTDQTGSSTGMSTSPQLGRKRRTWLRVVLGLILTPFLLLAAVALLLYLPSVQNLVRTKAIAFLEKKIGTPVQLDHLALRYPLGLRLEGLRVQDQQGDTLLYAGSLNAHVVMSELLQKRIVISSVELSTARFIVRQRPDSSFNFSYIIDAFTGLDTIPKPIPADSIGGWGFSMEKIRLENVRGEVDLRPSQLSLALNVGDLALDLDTFDTKAMRFYGGNLAISHAQIDLHTAPGPVTPDSYPLLKSPMAGLDVRLKELDIEQVGFTLVNTVRGDSLWLNIPSGKVDVEAMDLTQQLVKLDMVQLDAPRFGMVARERHVPNDSLPTPPTWLDQNDGFRFWVRDWNLRATELRIRDGDLQLHQDRIASPALLFDPQHIAYTALELDMRDLVFTNAHIAADIRAFSTVGGPHATPLKARVKLEATPALIALNDASLTAGNNTLDLSASAHTGELSTVYRAPKEVPLSVHLDADISMAAWLPILQDAGITVPAKWIIQEKWNTHLDFAGTAQNADTVHVDVVGDAGTVVHLRGKASGIASWPRTTFDADLRQLEMGNGLRQIASAYIPDAKFLPTRLSGQLHAAGSNGVLRTALRFNSDLGNVSGSATASLSTGELPDAVHTDLLLTDVQAGRFTGDTSLGIISLHLLADGHGLNTSARSGHVEVAPSVFVFRGNDLRSLRITGDLAGDSIHAQVTTDAAALATALDVHGRWPSRSDSLSATVALHLERLHLQELRLMDHPLNMVGDWKGAFSLSADHFGHVELTGDSILLSNKDRSFLFDQLTIAGHLGTDTTAVTVLSDALQVEYTSNIRIDSLVPNMREKLYSYFSADSSFTPLRGKKMALRVAIPHTEWLTGLVLPDLRTFELKTFTGSYDSDKDALGLDIDIPHAEYNQARINAFTVQVNAAGSELNGEVNIGRAAYDSLHVEHLELQAETSPGALLLTLHEHPESNRTHYEIPLEFTRTSGGLAMHIREGLLLDTLPWTADPANLLRFTADGPLAEHFILQGGSQHVTLLTDANATHLELDHYDLGTLVNFIATSDTVPFAAGIATGSLSLPLRGGVGLQVDMQVKDLTLIGTRLGDGALVASEEQAKNYKATAHLANNANVLDASASVDLAGSQPVVDARTTFDLKDIRFLQPFVSRFAYDLGGGLGADLHYTMQGGRSSMLGDVSFTDATVGVVATKSRYTLQKEHLTFDGPGLHLDNFTVRDSLNDTFVLDGAVHLDNASTRYDLILRTDSFQLAHSTAGSSKFFYGDLFAGIDLRITGTDRAPVVRGDLRILPGTDLSVILPGSKVVLVKSDGIVEFTTDLRSTDTTTTATDAEVLRDSIQAQLPKVDLDVRIHINDQAAFSVVLDPTTGDAASFQGNGDLRFAYSTQGGMYLSGPFTITQGGYTLEFYGLVKKRFDLVAGSKLTWTGDPLAAQMDIRTKYISKSASYPLVANSTGALSEVERNRLQAPLPYEVLININGELQKPNITFGLDLDRGYRNSYPQVNDQLDRLADATHADERNRQVFGLLVLNSFIQDESSGGAPSSGIASSAARSSVNGLLTDQMNKLTGRFIKGVDIQLGVNTVDQADGNSVYQRTSVDYKVSKSFLNKRLSFEVGGSVGVNEQDKSVSNVSSTRAAQYAILYDLDAEGRFRLRGFYENAFDLYDGDITDSGVALMYTKEFEENQNARDRARATAELRRKEVERQAREREEKERQKRLKEAPADPNAPFQHKQ